MTLASVLFHVAGLVSSAMLLRKTSPLLASLSVWLQSMVRIILGMLLIIVLHILEALAWALLYSELGEFVSLERALYFSVTTSTTLGYGDITLSPRWQLLSTFEAVSGLLLFGASTAFLLGLMKHLFDDDGVTTTT